MQQDCRRPLNLEFGQQSLTCSGPKSLYQRHYNSNCSPCLDQNQLRQSNLQAWRHRCHCSASGSDQCRSFFGYATGSDPLEGHPQGVYLEEYEDLPLGSLRFSHDVANPCHRNPRYDYDIQILSNIDIIKRAPSPKSTDFVNHLWSRNFGNRRQCCLDELPMS